MSKFNLYKYTSSNLYKNKVAHTHFFGYRREITYPLEKSIF